MCRNFLFWLFQILASKIMLLIQGFHVQWPLILFLQVIYLFGFDKKIEFHIYLYFTDHYCTE